MSKGTRAMGMGLLALGVIVLGFAAYVRLAPSDRAVWHVSPVTGAPADCVVQAAADSARLACVLAAPPAEVLARLDAVAMATPRTRRLSALRPASQSR